MRIKSDYMSLCTSKYTVSTEGQHVNHLLLGTENSPRESYIFISWTSKTKVQFWRNGILAKTEEGMFQSLGDLSGFASVMHHFQFTCELFILQHSV